MRHIASVDRLLVVHEARVAADELVEHFLRLPVAKAANLGTRAGFDRAVALPSRRPGAPPGVPMSTPCAGIAVLGRCWARTTTGERRRYGLLRRWPLRPCHGDRAHARIEAPFNDAAQEVVAATRTDARRGQRLAIGAEFNAVDRSVVAHVTRSRATSSATRYGRRIEGFGEEALAHRRRRAEEGLGRDDLAEALEQAARAALVDRARSLGDGRRLVHRAGRSYAQMSSYAEAGIRQYRIEAVLDETDHEHLPLPARQDLLRGRRPPALRPHRAARDPEAIRRRCRGSGGPGSRDGPHPALRGRRRRSDRPR